MASSSITGAVGSYFAAVTVPVIGLVPVHGDTVPSNDADGDRIALPYGVVRDGGGTPMRDLEGNFFGPTNVDVTVYAIKKGDARTIGLYWLFAGQAPEDRAGVESDTALDALLTGYTRPQVYIAENPTERETETRRADQLVYAYSFKLKVNAQKT